jgi:hypothetical protein
MRKVFETIKEELLAMLPPTIYFLIALSLVAEVHALMLKGTGISGWTSAQVLVGALLLGKAVLISDHLSLINRYPEKPLAYNIAWKSVIYFVIATLIHYIERLVDFWKEAGGLAAGNRELLARIVWPHFWALQIILLILIFNYCLLHELARVMGAAKMRQLFFGGASRVSSYV